jgi:hypothetical protein
LRFYGRVWYVAIMGFQVCLADCSDSASVLSPRVAALLYREYQTRNSVEWKLEVERKEEYLLQLAMVLGAYRMLRQLDSSSRS